MPGQPHLLVDELIGGGQPVGGVDPARLPRLDRVVGDAFDFVVSAEMGLRLWKHERDRE